MGVSKHTGDASKYMGAFKHIRGVQTYEASKHMGASKHTGDASKYVGASKHTGGVQTYGASKHTGGCPNIWGNPNVLGHMGTPSV